MAARSVGGLSIVGPIIRAIEVGRLEQQYGGSANGAGLDYTGGLISRDQLIQVIQFNAPI